MKKKFLYAAFAAFALINAACSSAPAPANTATANKPANSNVAVVTNTTNTAANTTNTTSTNANTGAATNTNSAASTGGADQDFKLINETGVEIHAVYVSPSDSDDWEKDVLGKDTLPAGESVDIEFDRAEKAAMWDLRVEDKAGKYIVWENLNLMEISELTLNYKDGKATAIKK